jgi:hypothetical protein
MKPAASFLPVSVADLLHRRAVGTELVGDEGTRKCHDAIAALAHRRNRVAAPSVRFLQIVQFSLPLQRMSALRPWCRMVVRTMNVMEGAFRVVVA